LYKTALKTDGGTPLRGSSTGLSRSHSSPNIAKMIQDEEAAAAPAQLPRQLPPDRSTKPQMMYACSRLGFLLQLYTFDLLFLG